MAAAKATKTASFVHLTNAMRLTSLIFRTPQYTKAATFDVFYSVLDMRGLYAGLPPVSSLSRDIFYDTMTRYMALLFPPFRAMTKRNDF
jgi:hypothetical protein